MAELSAKIAEARKAGYSDDEITSYLGSDSTLAPKIATAKSAGYSSAEILGHLEKAPVAAPKSAPKAAAKPYTVAGEVGSAWDQLKGDVQTALHPTPAQKAQAPAGQPIQRGANKYTSEWGAAADNLSGDVVGLITSPVRGAVTKFVNKPLAAATGVPEKEIGGWENALAIAAGSSPLLMGAGRGASPKNVLAREAPKPVVMAPRPKPMDLAGVTAAKRAAYDQVEKSGVAYTPEAFKALTAGVEADTKAANISTIRHPKAASMVADMQAMADQGHAPSLTELDQLRQVVRRDVANSRDDAEAFFGNKIIDRIDNFIETADAKAVSAGSAKDASGLITRARDLHQRQRKMEAVNDAVEKATLRAGSTGSGGNVDNAIRQNLRGVLEKGRGFTPDERAALESIVVGDKGQNALRQIGKLSPQGNGLMLGGQLAALVPSGGLSGVAALAGAGSKAAAEAITKRKVARLMDLIGDGGRIPAPATPPKGVRSQAINTSPKASNPSRSNSLGQDSTKARGR